MGPDTATEPLRQVDLLVAGLGPGGAAAALAARQLGLTTLAVEARGPEATRSQLILVRPGARAALARIGFADITEGRRTTTIRHVENRLRAALGDGGAHPHFEHRWHTSVVALAEEEGRVRVRMRHEADGHEHEVLARHVVDATGGRLAVPGRAERERVGPSHWVVTAEFATPPWFEGIVGLSDRDSHELMMLFPTWGRRGVIAYLDGPPGTRADEAEGRALLQRFEAMAAGLGLKEPLYPPWAVDVVQRLLPGPAQGRVLPIGDAVGTVDVLTGNGMSTAIEDAVAAVYALAAAQAAASSAASPDAEAALTQAAHVAVYRRHRRAMWRGRFILALRPLFERVWPRAQFPQVQRQRAGPPPLLWAMVRFVFGKRPRAGAS
jgi:flavin-dependent dehydrogenase